MSALPASATRARSRVNTAADQRYLQALDQARRQVAPARQPVEHHQATAHLEGARRRVVLVLDPDLAAQLVGQQRPGVLGRRRHHAVDRVRGALEILEAEQRLGFRSLCHHRTVPE